METQHLTEIQLERLQKLLSEQHTDKLYTLAYEHHNSTYTMDSLKKRLFGVLIAEISTYVTIKSFLPGYSVEVTEVNGGTNFIVNIPSEEIIHMDTNQLYTCLKDTLTKFLSDNKV